MTLPTLRQKLPRENVVKVDIEMHISSPKFFTSTALATVLLAQSAVADVSVNEVWGGWKDYMASYGYEVSATENVTSGGLTVSDLVMSMELPEEAGNLRIEFGQLDFADNGDGTVTISVPENLPIRFVTDSESETVDGKLMVTSDMTTVASGTADNTTYTYRASQIAMLLESLVVDGEAIEDVEADVVATGWSGVSTVMLGETVKNDGTAAIESIGMRVKGMDPDTGEPFDITATLTGMTAEASNAMPKDALTGDPSAFFMPGSAFDASYAYDTFEMGAAFTEDGAPGAFAMTGGAGAFAIDMNTDGMSYSGDMADISLKATGGEFPVPVDLSFGEIGYGFSMPLSASDEQQEFAFNLKLGDLAVSEVLWGMFDPGQVLPRDPANLLIDLAGMGTLFADLMTLDETSDDIPGEVNSLTIRDIQLNAAGASIGGNGAFTFDNTDLESFDGLPRPEGSVDLTIAGVNGLMDKLIQMGLLPEDQAMGARMMMSMFTQPGEGEDTLKSKIEINDKGQVLANGQRLK